MKIRLEMPRRTPPQKKYDESTKRFNLSLWGRQSGKTTAGHRKLLWKPLLGKENAVYWQVLQTYAAADVVYDRYMRFIHPHKDTLLKYKNESERRVELIGNRNIFFKSGQNFEDLRTESLDGCVIDEARQQDQRVWTMVIFPMLSKSKGWADIMSSPNGFDWLYDLKQSKATDPNWGVIHAPSSEAWWWTEEELAEAKKNMSDLQYRQEILAEFVNLRSGKVYYAFSDANKTETCPFAQGKWSPYHPLVLGPDFNVSPMSWSLGQYAYEKWWWFDEIRLMDSNTHEAALELRDKIMMMKEEGWRAADPGLLICGDASGKARSTKSNQSDYDILKGVLKEAGITYRDITPEANPSIKDRINAMNAQFKNAAGQISSFVHPTGAKWLVHDLERVVWKSGSDFTLDPGKDKMLTHMSDGAGYPTAELTPVKQIRSVGKTSIITRSI
jgi:hypothetical protein